MGTTCPSNARGTISSIESLCICIHSYFNAIEIKQQLKCHNLEYRQKTLLKDDRWQVGLPPLPIPSALPNPDPRAARKETGVLDIGGRNRNWRRRPGTSARRRDTQPTTGIR